MAGRSLRVEDKKAQQRPGGLLSPLSPIIRQVLRSLSGSAIDGLAQEVGVAVVAGVLLDHVAEDPTHTGRLEARRRAPDDTVEPLGQKHFFEGGPGPLDVLPHSAHRSSGVSPAECHPQSEAQSSESHGIAMSRPRSWWQNQ